MLGQGLLGFQRSPWSVSACAPAAVHAPQPLPFRLCSKDSRTVAPTSLLLYPCHHCPLSLGNSANEEFCKGPWAALLPGSFWVLLPPGFGYVCPSFVLFFLYPHLRHLSSHLPLHKSVSNVGVDSVRHSSPHTQHLAQGPSGTVFWANI